LREDQNGRLDCRINYRRTSNTRWQIGAIKRLTYAGSIVAYRDGWRSGMADIEGADGCLAMRTGQRNGRRRENTECNCEKSDKRTCPHSSTIEQKKFVST